MAATVDSKATFKARVVEFGLGDLYEKMVDRGLVTYAAMAFSCACTPGSGDEKPFIDQVVTPLVGENVARRPALRRLFFESFTLVTAELKNKVERTDDNKPHKMTLAERNARRDNISPKLSGLDLDGVHDPARFTIDLAFAM